MFPVYILAGLAALACVIYYVYARTKKPLSDMHIMRGNELVKKGEYDEAVKAYEKAIQLGKYKKADKITALNNLCLCYIYKNELDKAEEYANECMALSSSDAASRLMFGKIKYLKGDYEDALEFYKNYVEINPESDIAYSMLAMCYAQLCDAVNADAAVEKAVENHFNGVSALKSEVKNTLKEAKKRTAEK